LSKSKSIFFIPQRQVSSTRNLGLWNTKEEKDIVLKDRELGLKDSIKQKDDLSSTEYVWF